MKIGILQCDDVREELREQGFDNYPQMFKQRLHEVDPDLEFTVYRCLDGEIPERVDECDAFITTGSRYSALDDDPWIDALGKFMVKLVEARVPLVCICFGHQLLAKAMGGKVEKASVGWGVGVSQNTVNQKAGWMGDEAMTNVNLIVSHQDQVTEVPEGMTVMGGSDFCPVYFCLAGDSALTIQGHPEFSRAYSKALMEMRRGLIADDVIDAGMKSLDLRVDDCEVFRWIVQFMKQPTGEHMNSSSQPEQSKSASSA
ncbi:MAG: glutamine amidotransferase [marine bacterium B5-7]|nr:MAG: glutamine amidotransferase [marine bacterium B5-7]